MFSDRMKGWLLTALVVLLLASSAANIVLGRRAREEHLNALNVAARADSSEQVIRSEADSQVRVAHRQVEQKDVALAGALKGQEWWKGQALVAIRLMRPTAQGTHADTTSRSGNDTLYLGTEVMDSGAHVEIQARAFPVRPVRPDGAVGTTWTWNVTYHPIDLRVNLACARDTAYVQVAGPAWSNIAITHAEQRPDFCNPAPPGWAPFRIEVPSLPVAAALVVVGIAIGRGTK